jgi:hypothetical protein
VLSFDGQPVAGLSAINVTGRHSAVALVDNVATTPARVFDLRINSRPTSASVDGMTILRRAGLDGAHVHAGCREHDPGVHGLAAAGR